MTSMVLKNVKKEKGVETYYEFAKANLGNYKDFPVVMVDGIVTSLNKDIKENEKIVFEDITKKWGNRTYTKTLSLIFAVAFSKLHPDKKADLNHYIGSALYIDFEESKSLTLEEIQEIKEEMNSIIGRKLEIKTSFVSLNKAKEIFKNRNGDVHKLLNTIGDTKIGIVEVDDYIDINYSILAPNTEYIRSFKLMQYYPGLLLIGPNNKNNFDVNNYKEMPKLAKVFQNSTDHYKMLDLNKLSSINKKISRGESEQIVKISEATFNREIIEIAKEIYNDKDIKIILISGPTSSGKTTFANRLKVNLEIYGYSPITISMDDYFVERENNPIGENGEYDFDTPYAVDLELFNKDMYRLLNEERIQKREFNFLTGKGNYKDEYIVSGHNKPIMIEGIHALNPLISNLIPEKNKYKIYVSALNQVNLDANNRVSTSAGRFIRRAIRDERERGYSIEDTFKMWENVRKAEELYIFPFQEEADVLLNTSLPYETAILKKHIVPMLESIKRDFKYYNEARNLLNILDYFVTIEDDSVVSSESLLREFIGK